MTGKKLFSPSVVRNIAQNLLSFLKTNANYLLSDVFVPNHIDPTLLPLSHGSDDNSSEDYSTEDSDTESKELGVASIEVSKLHEKDYYQRKEKTGSRSKPEVKSELEAMEWSATQSGKHHI